MARLQEAVQARPECAVSHNNLGVALAKQRQFDAAVRHYREALRLSPGAAGTHANLGNALRDQGRLDGAVGHYRLALRLKPEAPDTHNNLGIAYAKQRRLDLALAHYEEALRLKSGFPEAHLNRAHAWLLQGNFRAGWPEYEWRWRVPGAEAFRGPQPLWDGSSLEERTILLHWEQGLGDTLQFIRYAPLVKAQGGRVIFQCQAPLLRLLSRCRGIDQLLPVGAPLPAFDVHAPLQSLPGLLGTTVETVPADIPYLFAEPALVERWRQELAPERWFKVGIAWQGNPKYGGDLHRSIPLAHFLPLAGVPGVLLYSLQKGTGSEQAQTAAARACVTDLAGRFDQGPGAFLDTAAVLKNLDLVITADTSLAHLAGGLGVPVWIALNAGSCWRWLLEREDSPWYPTARLFRQKELGNWAEVFERIAGALRQRVGVVSGTRPVAVEIAPGELIDKITILEIKSQCIRDEAKLRNVRTELAALEATRDRAVAALPELTRLTAELKALNAALWDIEDAVRDCERQADFGPRFVELARSVYRTNDRRAALKRTINELVGATIVEEKAYTPY